MLKFLVALALLSPSWAQVSVTPLKTYMGTLKQNQVKIGTLKYAGGGINQFGNVSIFEAAFSTDGITLPITFGDLMLVVATCPDPTGPCTAASQDLGGQGPTTTPVKWDWYGGHDGAGTVYTLPNCNDHGCVCLELQLVSPTGQPFSITLANGQTFTAPAITTISMSPLPGQAFIQIGQSVDIVLQAVR
jgi:hypothetical protein